MKIIMSQHDLIDNFRHPTKYITPNPYAIWISRAILCDVVAASADNTKPCLDYLFHWTKIACKISEASKLNINLRY